MTVKSSQLAEVLTRELENFSKEKTEQMKAGVKEAAKKTTHKLKATKQFLPKHVPPNPSLNNSKKTVLGVKSGNYKSQFAHKKGYETDIDIRQTIYVKSPDYRLTHLLEHGHRIVLKGGVDTGKRTRPITHFEDAKEYAKTLLPKEVKARLG